jgi:hypothetical protein
MSMPTERYYAKYQEGYYVVVDSKTGTVIPPDPKHPQRYRDGLLFDYAAAHIAHLYNTDSINPALDMRNRA